MTKVTTMQKTAKKWKGLLLTGKVFFVLSFLSLFNYDSSSTGTISLFMVGGILWTVGRLGKWWCHE